MVRHRLALLAATALLVSASDLAAQACVGGQKLQPARRMVNAGFAFEFSEPGTVGGVELGFLRQDNIIAGMSLEVSTLFVEDPIASTRLSYLFGPAGDGSDTKGWCALLGLHASNLGDFDNAGFGGAFIGGAYGVERKTSFGLLVPFGSVLLDYSGYAGTLDLGLDPETSFLLEGGAGLRWDDGTSFRASLRKSTVQNSKVSLRITGTLALRRWTRKTS